MIFRLLKSSQWAAQGDAFSSLKIDLMARSYSFGKSKMVGRNSTLIHSNC
jgi:hypothetical protein